MTKTDLKKQQKANKLSQLSVIFAVVWIAMFLLMIPIASGTSGVDVDLPGIFASIILLAFLGLPTIGFLLSAISLRLKKSEKGFMALAFHVLIISVIIYLVKMFVDSFCVIC